MTGENVGLKKAGVKSNEFMQIVHCATKFVRIRSSIPIDIWIVQSVARSSNLYLKLRYKHFKLF